MFPCAETLYRIRVPPVAGQMDASDSLYSQDSSPGQQFLSRTERIRSFRAVRIRF